METKDAVNYIIKNNIEGDFIECGVLKGSNEIIMIKELQKNNQEKNIWMYDTFDGMTSPSEFDWIRNDKNSFHKNDTDVMMNNEECKNFFKEQQKDGYNKWCYCSLDKVKKTLSQFNYNENLLHYIKGNVCQTLLDEKNLPNKISLLRLDTDFYDSSKVELEVLYPRLVKGGVLILDDYYLWEGQRKATDDYFEKIGFKPEFKKVGRKYLKGASFIK